MTDDLGAIGDVALSLLRRIDPAQRRPLMRAIARDVRRAQSERIARQLQPDGSPFAPRKAKPQNRLRRQGGIRRKAMFAKLRLAKHLRAGASPDEAWVGFTGRAARIARVHQEGQSDSPAPGQARVRYVRRTLIGLTDAERERVLDLLLAHVAA